LHGPRWIFSPASRPVSGICTFKKQVFAYPEKVLHRFTIMAVLVGLLVLSTYPSDSNLMVSSHERGLLMQQPASVRLLVQQSASVRWTVSPPSGAAPLNVTFEAKSNTSPSFTWFFGDGNSANGAKVRYTYYRPGEYRARLEARFPSGGRSQGEIAIRVSDNGPERARMTVLFDTGTRFLFDARASVVYAPLRDARWFFGDGSSAQGLVVRKDFVAGAYPVRLEVDSPNGRLAQTINLRAAPLSNTPSFEDEVINLTNAARAAGWDCGLKAYPANPRRFLPALRRNAQLDVAARSQSAAMALHGYFDHQSQVDGSQPADRANASGYAWSNIAENIAAGQATPTTVVNDWLRSPGHCRNIMDDDLTEIGVSHVLNAQGRPFWTQVFGKPRS
jgi:uncharacterized protein YkwD